MSRRSPIRKRGPGRPSLAESDEHRDALLDVATAVFVEAGYAGASMNEIARRAGASKNTLYRWFPSKAELFSAMMTRRLSGEFLQLDELIRQHGATPVALLHLIASGALASVVSRDQSRLRRAVVLASEEFPELSRTLWERFGGQFTSTLAAYFETPPAREVFAIEDAAEAADVFASLVLGLVPMRADMNVLPTDRQWIERRARARVEAFVRLYGRAHASTDR